MYVLFLLLNEPLLLNVLLYTKHAFTTLNL